ncbi:unnamed protein product [Linum tenue]|uniref:Uncharacterized protein n=1 Tax=Linum tenue TaxID=586396 RepID=A0AAV0IS14_9ROSI|nr:unnamed protein product [Linum tenue]
MVGRIMSTSRGVDTIVQGIGIFFRRNHGGKWVLSGEQLGMRLQRAEQRRNEE